MPRAHPASPDGYLPIEEHAIVGDLRTVALVGTDGTIDWYCPARFDAPALFAALLDADKGGFLGLPLRLAPGRRVHHLRADDARVPGRGVGVHGLGAEALRAGNEGT